MSIGSFLYPQFARNALFPDSSRGVNNYLNQVPDELKKYLTPYADAGSSQLPGLSGQYGDLMKDPGDIISRIGAGYKQSPGFQWQLGQGESAINNASAAGGMAGTPQHQQQAGQLAENMANQDYGQYMDRALGQYDFGLQGSQHMADQGFNASNSLATNLAQLLMSQAGLKYASNANDAQQRGGLFGNLIGAAGGMF